MGIAEIATLIGNVGLPIAIVVYMIWRFDKFLTQMCGKLDKYNDKLATISESLIELVAYTKGLSS